MMAGFRGALSIGGMAATIKLMKYWYVKEQRNLQLQKQNAESQLQLLKAQVHPHFLFNTLNNIYSHTQTTSPVASQMITGLSSILRFMLYESSQEVVPLAKEIKMISDYIDLEKVRYGTRLDLQVRLPVQADEYYITPLLLLPLVENSFKHGASNILDQPWISLDISLDGNLMQMKLINAKSDVKGDPESSGIGIRNVRERLALLYPGRHELDLREEADVFIVNLKMQLSKVHTIGVKQSQIIQAHE
ncbi:MAG: two-component system sensor protein [Chitinophagaceae bacterium]|nr:MAG: two-component system sensor protein [Chitinophagaceae bacterium]